MAFGKVLVALGSCLLGFSAYSHRDYVKHAIRTGRNQHSDALITLEVIIQVLVSFLLILLGSLLDVRLKSIRMAPDIKAATFEEVMTDSDYVVFNHRGRELQKLGSKLKR